MGCVRISCIRTPGAHVDYVDINFYGPLGVSVPGGYIDDGEWTYLL